ncbi:MAG: HAD family hydrolase [Gemmatimonadota bacterium]|nr:MAG: HAD family hydrolase [Gemmatimonadota bacterium]
MRAANASLGSARFDLIIFDNDGVLVDSEPHANLVLAELLTELGVATTYEESVAEFLGTSLPYVRSFAERRLGAPLPEIFERLYHDRLFERLRGRLEAVDGVASALRRIRQPRCVASSGSRERIEFTLREAGLWEEFRHAVFSGDDVPRGKPAPDLFLYAASSMGVPPARCAVIEDSPLGIQAAAAAGMTSFGYAGATAKERLAMASVLFERMEELPFLLR